MTNSTHGCFKLAATTLILGMTAVLPAQAAEELKFYNWSDYIAPDTIANFEKETGIDVIADVFDSNEVLEAKLLTGSSGFDLVVPSSSFMGRQIIAGAFQPLNKSKIPNLKNLDPKMMDVLSKVDPDNAHGVPYLWGTTGIGYNIDKVREVLGDDAPVDSWDLIFKPENIKKLASCGVAILDAPSEIIPLSLHYLGKDPNSFDRSDYKMSGPVGELLQSIRPHVTYFHSSQYINDLANGDICVAVGWSGDIIQAATRAEESDNGVKIDYSIPKEGTVVWFDMLTIPADASNTDNAHKFIDYLMRPEVMADISNYVAYANANLASVALIDAEIVNDKTIFPSDAVKAKLFSLKVLPRKIDRVMTRLWTDFKSGR
ncbi:MAG: putrescine transport system substrate-binding protein [Motiliproteus sp.]|jgi:putrescine transport system substrate-binding protein